MKRDLRLWMQNLKRGFHHYELSTTFGPFTTGPARDSDAVTVTDIVCDRAGRATEPGELPPIRRRVARPRLIRVFKLSCMVAVLCPIFLCHSGNGLSGTLVRLGTHDFRHRHNFNLNSTHQAAQVRNKERNTREHREQRQADVEQQGWETPPHKPGAPAGLKEGLARA